MGFPSILVKKKWEIRNMRPWHCTTLQCLNSSYYLKLACHNSRHVDRAAVGELIDICQGVGSVHHVRSPQL